MKIRLGRPTVYSPKALAAVTVAVTLAFLLILSFWIIKDSISRNR